MKQNDKVQRSRWLQHFIIRSADCLQQATSEITAFLLIVSHPQRKKNALNEQQSRLLVKSDPLTLPGPALSA